MARDQRRLAAIVSADVAGYSRLMGEDESRTLAALKDLRRELVDPKIAEYGGRIVKTTGDGLLLEFPSVVEAVRCAVDVQRGMVVRSAEVPADQTIEFRIGVNLGDIIIDGEDIYGDGVNVAARLQALAPPGGICASRAVRDQVLDKLSFTFEDLGAQEVKNIARPIEVYRVRDEAPKVAGPRLGATVAPAARMGPTRWLAGQRSWVVGALVLALAGVGAWQAWRSMQGANVPPAFSVAVMPFVAATASADEEKLAVALTDNVRAVMGKSRLLRVAAPRNVLESRGKSNDPQAIGRALNVRYLIDGSVRIVEGQATIIVQLTDAAAGTQVWSDRLTTSDFASTEHHAAVAAKIRMMAGGALIDKEVQRAAANATPASAADHWALGSREESAAFLLSGQPGYVTRMLAARRHFDDALRVDPNFVPALDGIADVLDHLLSEDLESDSSTRRQRIDELGRITARAVLLDDGYDNAWYERTDALVWLERFDQALEANAKARALNPTPDSASTTQHGWLLLLLNRPEEALAVGERAIAMSHSSGSGQEGFAHRTICQANLLLGRYDAAVAACEKSAANDDWWLDQMYLTAGYAQLGNAVKAAAAKAALLAKKPTFTIEKFKATDPGIPGYQERAEAHFYAGLRKAGIPEQ